MIHVGDLVNFNRGAFCLGVVTKHIIQGHHNFYNVKTLWAYNISPPFVEGVDNVSERFLTPASKKDLKSAKHDMVSYCKKELIGLYVIFRDKPPTTRFSKNYLDRTYKNLLETFDKIRMVAQRLS